MIKATPDFVVKAYEIADDSCASYNKNEGIIVKLLFLCTVAMSL